MALVSTLLTLAAAAQINDVFSPPLRTASPSCCGGEWSAILACASSLVSVAAMCVNVAIMNFVSAHATKDAASQPPQHTPSGWTTSNDPIPEDDTDTEEDDTEEDDTEEDHEDATPAPVANDEVIVKESAADDDGNSAAAEDGEESESDEEEGDGGDANEEEIEDGKKEEGKKQD